MNTQITEDYVSFEIAKLLREKGFEGDCNATYGMMRGELSANNPSSSNGGNLRCLAPTLQMAMKWLREVHNLHIYTFYVNGWIFAISDLETGEEFTRQKGYSSEDAIEAAIKHCLINLI